MNEIRSAYLDCLQLARDLIACPEVAARWNEDSVLAQWSVAGLCGHVTRAFTGTLEYLDADPDPDGKVIGAGAYYAAVLDTDDLDSELHRGIRGRGDKIGAKGHAEVLRIQQEALAQARQRLASEPESRKLRVFKGIVMSLDDYLETRLVELTLHIDDVALSVGLPTPELPPNAVEHAIEALVSTARQRHGDLAVLRAFARRERDPVEALRVF